MPITSFALRYSFSERMPTRADRIRDYLASKGVTLVDTAQGTTYKMD